MPPKKQRNGWVDSRAEKMKKRCMQETPQERNERLAKEHRAAIYRTTETIEQHERQLQFQKERARKEKQRKRAAQSRARERATQCTLAMEGFHYSPNKNYSQHSRVATTVETEMVEVTTEATVVENTAAEQGGGRMPGTSIPFSLPCNGAEPDQGPVAFGEVAMLFTEEEWALLDPDQRALHKEVMEENWQTLLSLETFRMPATFILSSFPFDGEEVNQCPVTFEEVAVYFSWEEWALLDPDQKALHKNIMEENWLNVSSLAENWREKNICFKCGKRFMHELELAKHQRTHTEDESDIQEKPYKCIMCGKYFTIKLALMFHKRIHNRKKHFINEMSRKCLDCKFHHRFHKGKKIYECQECHKCFSHSSLLVVHKRVHTGEKPYKCQECGKYFAQNSYLVRHKRVHTGEKPYKCQECGKCFAQNSYLVVHKRVHTGEKPYKCQECGKCFGQNAHLVKHKRVHTGEKSYKCQKCGKCFAQKSFLLGHQLVHTGEKPYKCQECGKCFTHNSDLVKHKRVHTGEKPYKCQICEKCFARNSHLTKHKRIHMGENHSAAKTVGIILLRILTL